MSDFVTLLESITFVYTSDFFFDDLAALLDLPVPSTPIFRRIVVFSFDRLVVLSFPSDALRSPLWFPDLHAGEINFFYRGYLSSLLAMGPFRFFPRSWHSLTFLRVCHTDPGPLFPATLSSDVIQFRSVSDEALFSSELFPPFW